MTQVQRVGEVDKIGSVLPYVFTVRSTDNDVARTRFACFRPLPLYSRHA